MGCRKLTYYDNKESALAKNLFFEKGTLEKRYAEVKKGLVYYPFGMQMPGRTFSSNQYRYGFQGQEKDDEIKGEGNSINYKYRMHDPRTGRFFAVDPLAAKYPHNSVYAFSENRVIDGVELEGLEYLNSTKSLLYYHRDYLILKTDNVNRYTKSALAHNRIHGHIGDFSLRSEAAGTSESANVFKPITKIDYWLPVRGYTKAKGNLVVTGYKKSTVKFSGKGGGKAGLIGIAADAGVSFIKQWASYKVGKDLDIASSQLKYFNLAMSAYVDAYNSGYLPQEIANSTEAVGDIVNYVLQGQLPNRGSLEYKNEEGSSIVIYPDVYKKMIEHLGQNIYKTYSSGGSYDGTPQYELPNTQEGADNMFRCGPPKPEDL